jgi:hypothetical protein
LNRAIKSFLQEIQDILAEDDALILHLKKQLEASSKDHKATRKRKRQH